MEQTIINTYMSVQYLYIESIGQIKYYEKDFHAKRVKPVRFDYEKTFPSLLGDKVLVSNSRSICFQGKSLESL